jgi:hypothetical protein
MPKIDLARIRRRQIETIDRAKAMMSPNPDGGYTEDVLRDKLVEILPFDVEKARRKQAQALIDAVARPGGTEPNGQIVLPGFDAIDYEPGRLIRDNSGNLYECDRAPLTAIMAESGRARDHANAALHWSNIKANEAEIFAAWVIDELTKGRPAADLTFGNCLREAGLWRPGGELKAS